LTTYSLANKDTKEFEFSLDFLYLPKFDNVPDEFNFMSHAEEMLDLFLQYLRKDPDLSITSATGLTIKSVNADYATGIRLDIKITTGRYCPPDCITYTNPTC
jgi:hypothetical protein